jgi:cobalt-zinc-cadmium efflux system outer membrane protein
VDASPRIDGTPPPESSQVGSDSHALADSARLGDPLMHARVEGMQSFSSLVQEGPLPAPKPKPLPLVLPPDLPGSQAPPITWPKGKAERERVVQELYPSLPPLPADVAPAPGPDGRPLSLADLQRLASANNPAIKNAIAAVEAAKGAVIQAGAYPNPTVAWEADTVGTNGAGYQGAYIDQPIKGANKIKLAVAAAEMDLRVAEVALRKARSDLATQVRSNYFGVLVARENMKVSRALAQFTDRVFRVQVDLLAGGVAAPYEPMQMRPLALQARFNLTQATNQYQASWRQLASSLGLPGMPATAVAGRVDMPVPVFDYDKVLTQVLNRHTDVQTAFYTLQKNRYLLDLARSQPFPDFDVRVLVQKDYSTPPFLIAFSAVLGMTVPVWDQNKGGILQAGNQVSQALFQVDQSKLQLTNSLADAFNRYETAREQVRMSLLQVEDQLRAYRGVYERHGQAPDEVGFGDVVTAQQTLATYISGYVTALGLQWTAVVDIANLLQTPDLFQDCETQPVYPVPEVAPVLPAPRVLPDAPPGL